MWDISHWLRAGLQYSCSDLMSRDVVTSRGVVTSRDVSRHGDCFRVLVTSLLASDYSPWFLF